MKKIAKHIIAALAGFFRSNISANKSNPVTEGKGLTEQKLAAKILDDDDIHYCHHQRHGMFPVSREFLALSRTESGRLASIFQCRDPRCREFVAAVFNTVNGQKTSQVSFRGQNFRSRPDRRARPVAPGQHVTPRSVSPQPRSLLRAKLKPSAALLAVGLSLLLVGCSKSYKTQVNPDENITASSTVEIDGRADAGTVKRIYVDPTGQQVAEFTTGSEPLRQGTVRIRRNGIIALCTANAAGHVLATGTCIPVESKLTFATKRWGASAIAILAVAAVAAVVCLRRFLAFQAATPFIPLLAAVGLALITAYAAHDFVLPVIQKLQAKTHPASPPATIQNSAPTMTDGEWNGKVRSIENQVVEFLRTPTDAARLLAFLSTFLITLPIYACTIAWLFRKLRYQPTVCGLMLLATLPSAVSAASVKREDVESSLRNVETLALRAEELGAEARRLDKAGLQDQAQVYAVQAYFSCDRAANIEEIPTQQIALISGWHASSETKATFQSRLRNLAQRRAGVEDVLAEIAGAITNSLTRIYLIERASVKNRIRAGDTDEERLISQLSALSRVPQSLVREHVVSLQNLDRLTFEAGKIRLPDGQVITLSDNKLTPEPKRQDDGKTAADLARLQNEQGELQNQLARLRSAQEEAASHPPVPARIVVITNQVEKLVPVPAPTPPPEIRYVTNTVTTRSETNAPAVTGLTDGAVAKSQARIPAQINNAVRASPKTEKNPRVSNVILIASIAGGCAAVGGLIWLSCISFMRGRLHLLSLSGQAGKRQEIEVAALDDAVCLESSAIREAANRVNGTPNIIVGWRGPVLRPGTHCSVRVNDTTISRSHRLFPGDRIIVEGEKPQEFTFLACDPVDAATAAED